MLKVILFDCLGVLFVPATDLDWLSKRRVGRLVLNQELLNFAQQLRSKYKVGLLTNIVSLDKFFTRDEQIKYFDDVVSSAQVGMSKPSLDIYHLAAKRLGCKVGECLLIDDSEVNCRAAIKAGMQAILYKANQELFESGVW